MTFKSLKYFLSGLLPPWRWHMPLMMTRGVHFGVRERQVVIDTSNDNNKALNKLKTTISNRTAVTIKAAKRKVTFTHSGRGQVDKSGSPCCAQG